MSERKTIGADALRALAAKMLAAKGMPEQDAATMAEVLVWASLRGVDSHGITRLVPTMEWIDKGIVKAAPAIRVERPRAAVLAIHADRAAGPVAMTRAADEVIAVARETGTCWASVAMTTHICAIGYYAERIAKAGMVGIGICAGMPNMGYAGVKGAAVATSPLTIAAPSEKGAVLLDMATATIALGRIKQYKAKGLPLPGGAALTEAGEPTTDPALAAIPTPMAGPKGSGMSFMFEILTGVLAGVPTFAPFHARAEGAKKHRQNAALIAVDPAAFGDVAAFRTAVSEAVGALHALPRADEAVPVLAPGERGAAAAAERAQKGIVVAPKLWGDISQAAAALGIAVD